MAQFRAGIQGNRGMVTRLGSAKSGITAFVNGWRVGVDVTAHHDAEGDYIEIHVTGGSSGHSRLFPLATVREGGNVTVHCK